MIATTLDQSKKLLELGIKATTADMHYTPINPSYPWFWDSKPLLEKDAVPAWSLPALLLLLPQGTMLSKGTSDDNDESTIYWVYLDGLDYTSADYNNPISPCCEVLEWLKQNKYI